MGFFVFFWFFICWFFFFVVVVVFFFFSIKMVHSKSHDNNLPGNVPLKFSNMFSLIYKQMQSCPHASE